MRRLFIAILCVVGLGISTEASAQIDLGKALGALINEASSTVQSTPDYYAKLRESAPAKGKIVGTWQYRSARVEYLGANPVVQVAMPQLETLIDSELKREGVVEGCCSLTINRKGTATISAGNLKYDGSYTYDQSTAKAKASYVIDNHTYNISGYLKLSSSRLMVLIDIRDVLRELTYLSPKLANDENFLMVKGVVDSFGDIYLSVLFQK